MLALENKANSKALVFPEVSRNATSLFAPHFDLHQQPFTSNMDRRQYFSHESAMEVINTLQYALRSGEGITKVIGESGTGKTYLTANLLAAMSNDFHVIKLLYPAGSSQSLLKTILDEMCISYHEDMNNQQLTKLILAALCDYYARYEHPVVLVIDNAERMPLAALATLSTLNNLETQYRKLLQTILIGTPELDEKLSHGSLDSLRQRIGFVAELKALTREQTLAYVDERVKLSQNEVYKLFADDALTSLYKYSRGLPRLINLISYKAMMLAYGQGLKVISRKHVVLAAKDTQQVKDYLSLRFPLWGYIPFTLAFIGCVALVFIKFV